MVYSPDYPELTLVVVSVGLLLHCIWEYSTVVVFIIRSSCVFVLPIKFLLTSVVRILQLANNAST